MPLGLTARNSGKNYVTSRHSLMPLGLTSNCRADLLRGRRAPAASCRHGEESSPLPAPPAGEVGSWAQMGEAARVGWVQSTVTPGRLVGCTHPTDPLTAVFTDFGP